MRARRLTVGAVALLCVVVALLVFGGAQALAAMEYVPGPVLGGPCTGIPCGDGQFSEPAGVAVDDATHDVYVVDEGDNRVEYFSANGAYVGQFAGSATPAGSFSEPEAVAIDDSGKTTLEDPSVGDVYVGDSSQNVVGATGKYEGQFSGRCEVVGEASPCAGSKLLPFEGIGGVAVDGQGNLWVLEYGGGRVDEFNDEGVYVGGFEDGYGHAHAIAAEPDGSLVIARGPSEVRPSG
jgi:DNA-binding beta-propeller fold protein YncE